MRNFTNEQLHDLDELKRTAMTQWVLPNLKPANAAQLLSAARSEFIVSSGSLHGRFMRGFARLMDSVAQSAYGTRFLWSEYNRGQWFKFVVNEIGVESGACMFSAEPGGTYPEQTDNGFKGIGVGKPLGIYPLELWCILAGNTPNATSAVAKFDYSSV